MNRGLSVFTLFFVVVSPLFLGVHVIAQDWAVETVAEGRIIENLSPDGFRIGSDGSIHTVYGGGHLIYQVRASDGVTIETVDYGLNTGSMASLALDGENNPYIVYRDDQMEQLVLKYRVAGEWETVCLDSGFTAGWYNAIECDEAGNPHIVFANLDRGDFRYTYRQASGFWQTEVIDSTRYGFHCALTMYNGYPRVVYGGGGDLVVAYRDSIAWTRSVYSVPDNIGYGCAMDISADGMCHIVCYNTTSSSIHYVNFDGSVFGTFNHIANCSDPGQMDLVVDSTGMINVIYGDTMLEACRIANGINDTWTFSTIAVGAYTGRMPSITQASDGNSLCFRFLDQADGILYGGSGTISSGWQTYVLDQSIRYGLYPVLVQDSTGYPHSFFLDLPGLTLQHATYNGFNWTMNEISMPETSGTDFDVIMLPDDSILIYMIEPEDTIRVLYYDGIQWTSADVITFSGPISSVKAEMDSTGKIYVVCQDSANIKLVFLESSSWNGTYVQENIADSYDGCDILVDSNDLPHIVYFDNNIHLLRHTWRIGTGSWHSEDMVPEHYNRLIARFDSTNKLFVTGSSSMTVNLPIIYATGGVYETHVIPDTLMLQPGISFDISADDLLGFSYRVMSQGTLRYATFDGSTWNFVSPETRHQIGAVSLVFSDSMGPVLGCQSSKTGDLLIVTDRYGVFYDLRLNSREFLPGDPFILTHHMINNSLVDAEIDEYIILDVLGAFWFWPSWSEEPDFGSRTVFAESSITGDILNFSWPSGTGSFSGIIFWGGVLSAGTSDLLAYDYVEWGYVDM